MKNDINLINKLLFHPNVSKDIHYNLSSGIVLYFENQIKSKSLILILKEIIIDDLMSKLIVIQTILNEQVTCKLIGNEDYISQISKILNKHNIEVSKEIKRNNGFELVYFPIDNKLRISRDIAEAKKSKIKTLIVDDSPTIRSLLQKILEQTESFEVLGSIGDPLQVDHFLSQNKIDLITLDIHMPGLDGVQLLKKIFPKYHIPTVMISSIRIEEGPYILEALEYGAVDYIEKPSLSELNSITPYILEKLKAAAYSKTKRVKSKVVKTIVSTKKGYKDNPMILIGASTGGVEALKDILEQFPAEIPPVLIVQHIPAVFSKALADRLDKLCKFKVKEAEPQEEVTPNKVLIAPGGKHLKLIDYSGTYRVIISDGDEVNRFKPSVDVLFNSAAQCCPPNTVAALLTGMGCDGAKGLLALKKKGVKTIAQNEKTCVVYGMPREAIELGAADYIEPLDEIAEKLINLVSK